MIGGVEIRQLLGSVDGGTEVVWVNLRTLEMCDFDTLQIYTGKYSNAVGSGLWRLHPLGFEEFGRRKRDKEFLGEKN